MGKKRIKDTRIDPRRGLEAECTSRPSSRLPQHVLLPEAVLALPLVPPSSTNTPHPASLHPVVQTLLEDGEGTSMMVASPVLTPEECAAWIQWGESTGFALEKHAQTSQIAHRDNGRLAVESEEIARAIAGRLEPWMPAELAGRRPSGCNPNIRLYRYKAGQRFGPHVDQSNRLASGATTEFTVLIYLNEDVEGGETTFFGVDGDEAASTLRFAPQAGAALVHAHGWRCLTHEGSEVRRGTKYLLRTDFAYR